VLELGESNTLK
jgi:hypothetical protein